MMLKEINGLEGIFAVQKVQGIQYATQNAVPGIAVYREKLFEYEGKEYRQWIINKSKLASGISRGIKLPVLKSGAKVLYLGASSGTTVSHVSDIVGDKGLVYAIEFAPRPTRDLIKLANHRKNIVPILADARRPEEYTHIVDAVDMLYADVAQPNQSELFVLNAEAFLKTAGTGFIAIKTRSISQVDRPGDVFNNEVEYMEKNGFETVRTVDISKIHRQHRVFLGIWK